MYVLFFDYYRMVCMVFIFSHVSSHSDSAVDEARIPLPANKVAVCLFMRIQRRFTYSWVSAAGFNLPIMPE